MEFKKSMSRSLASAVFLLTALLVTSCDGNRIYEENKTIPETGWTAENNLKFDVEIKDPSTPANFYINVRHADGYPYGNLFLFITTKLPDGKSAIDTLECILADEKGKWIGKGLGDIYDNQIPFKKNMRFPQAGTYHFEIGQGMRVDNIPLIMDVGLRIEKVE